jgi:hypothetical protein
MTQPAILKKSVIYGVPVVLGLLETAHPALWPNDPIFPMIHPIATWWTVLHVLQVPLFALLGLAVLFLVAELKSPFATISRYSIVLFIVVYPAFDAAVGISSGLICRKWSAADGPLIEGALQEIFWGPVTGTMAMIGSGAWLIALVCAAVALRKSGASVAVAVALALSGILLAISHVRPFGPLACLCFLVAAVLSEMHGRERGRAASVGCEGTIG